MPSIRRSGSRTGGQRVQANGRGEETRQRILATAERLFAEHGYEGVSLRTIVAQSTVNLAAIHYHFGSKEGLFEEVFARRARVIINKRLALLDTCANGPGRPPLLEQILEAFLRPVVEDDPDGGGGTYAKIRTWLAADKSKRARELPSRYFHESSRRFLEALAETLPHLPPEDLFWRFHFLLGAMFFTIANPARIEYLSDQIIDTTDEESSIRYLVKFFAEAFAAPAICRKASQRRQPLRRQKPNHNFSHR